MDFNFDMEILKIIVSSYMKEVETKALSRLEGGVHSPITPKIAWILIKGI